VVYRGSEIGCEVIGIARLGGSDARQPAGSGEPYRYVLPLNRENTAPSTAPAARICTVAHQPVQDEKLPRCSKGRNFRSTSLPRRCDLQGLRFTKAVLKNIETLNLDYLIAIGGDDTLSYARNSIARAST